MKCIGKECIAWSNGKCEMMCDTDRETQCLVSGELASAWNDYLWLQRVERIVKAKQIHETVI